MRLALVGKETVADGTMAFRFRPESPVTFVAGQFGEFSIPGTDPSQNTRTFSLANAPGEDHLLVVTRMRDTPFKRWLKDAPDGAAVEFSGPFGRFVLPTDTDRQVVFLAGGIGITPARSMIRHSLSHGTGHRLVLVYANRTLAAAAFDAEFSEPREGFTYLPILSDETREGVRSGRIDEAFLRETVEVDSAVFYVVGPPGMVLAMRTVLAAMDVPPERIVSEDFSGY